MPLWFGVLASMGAGAAVAVPLIGAPVLTCSVLLVLALGYIAVRCRRRAVSSDAAVRLDDLVTRLRPDPTAPKRRRIAEQSNRDAA